MGIYPNILFARGIIKFMEDIISILIKSFQYGYIIKALLAGSFIAISASVLGIFLVLRRFSLIGDGLAHVSFATVALSLLISINPLIVSIPLVIASSLLILKLTEKTHVYSDSAIGIVSGLSLAIGYIIISLASGSNIDLSGYLFGSILIITDFEVIVSLALSILILGIVFLFLNELFCITYDQEFSRVLGINVTLVNYILVVLVSITIVLGVRVVGTMLISSLIIFPAITALQIIKSFFRMIIFSILFAVLSVFLGIFISIILNIPSGPTIVCVNVVFFIFAFLLNKILKLK